MYDSQTKEASGRTTAEVLHEIVTMYALKEDVYAKRDPRNTIIDGEPRALYWYPYRRTFEVLKNRLTIGHPVDSELPIIVVGRSELIPTDFDLTKGDRETIEEFAYPGVSMHIAFTDNCYAACGAIFDRVRRPCEHLFYIPHTKDFLGMGYIPYYLPTPNQPLHLRVVHKRHLEDPSLHMVPFSARKRLAEYVNGFKVC